MANQSDIVVTAAHCVSRSNGFLPPDDIKAVFGVHDLNEDEPTVTFRSVRNYVSHMYSYEKDDNDIAILRLTELVTYTKEISPLCLPTKHTVTSEIKHCFAAGWGRTETDEMSTVLKQTRMHIAPMSQCPYAERVDRAICARTHYKGSIPCRGDSGSPLFCEIRGRYFALGILSLGPRNCTDQENDVGLYARLDIYNEWIRKKIKLLKTAPDQSMHTVMQGHIRAKPKLNVPGLLSLVHRGGKTGHLQATDLIAILSGYHERLIH
uniref:Peptidase S1 domain-containing protein n=1 Tax=Trichuris muris TaxID=70415 RepID=A0A5S6QA49_TRIMR